MLRGDADAHNCSALMRDGSVATIAPAGCLESRTYG